jgi:plasmid stabilization system protein ParE
MAYELKWTELANSSLNDIINYIESNFGESAAAKYVKIVYSILDKISIFPYMGKLEESKYNYRTVVIEKKTTLIYVVESVRILLFKFFDNRFNPEAKFSS